MSDQHSPTEARPRIAPRNWTRHWLFKDVIVPVLITRTALVIVAWIAMNQLPHSVGSELWELSARGMKSPVGPVALTRSRPFTNMWSRWDASWYHNIAAHGYRFTPGTTSNTAFFPAYPMLMRATHLLIMSESDAGWFAAGIIASNVALGIAMAYLLLLVRLDFDDDTARRSILYFLVFPTTLFLSAVYSESLFLALAIGAFYHARKRNWWLAGLLACGAALTRPTGIIVSVGLLAEYLLQLDFNWRKIRADVLALALAPLGLLCYAGYLHFALGSATAVSQAQAAWGLKLQPAWRTFTASLSGPIALHAPGPHSLVDLVFALTFIGLACAVALRMRISYGVYAVAYLAFITSWGSLESAPRYVLGIFPAIVWLAYIGRRAAFDRLFTVASMALAAMFMALFALWAWVA